MADGLPLPDKTKIAPEDREFWLKIRQALLIQLAAIEERLDLPRTRAPHPHKK